MTYTFEIDVSQIEKYPLFSRLPAVSIGGVQWVLKLQEHGSHLGVFVEALLTGNQQEVGASFRLDVEGFDYCHTALHVFTPHLNDWGFAEFCPMDDISNVKYLHFTLDLRIINVGEYMIPFGPHNSWNISLNLTRGSTKWTFHTAVSTQNTTLVNLIISFVENFRKLHGDTKIRKVTCSDWHKHRCYIYKIGETLMPELYIPSLRQLTYSTVVKTGQKDKLQELLPIEDLDDLLKIIW
jgi:hypothetical protein